MLYQNKIIPNYLGSKTVNGLLQFIINHIPIHSTYVESHLGSGGILLNKKPAKLSYCFDKDSSIIDKFKSTCSIDNCIYVCGDFITEFSILLSEVALIDSFIYVDPPYVPSTRTSNNKYKHEMTLFDHTELLTFLDGLDCRIMISCYDNPLYKELLSNWFKATCKSMTRGGARLETIYYNYELKQLHDTRYVGKDFTDRQRIKRKVSRMISKLDKLDSQELQVLVAAVIDKYVY